MRHRFCRRDQLRGLAKVRVGTGGGYQGRHFPLLGHGTGVGQVAGFLVHRQRFTRECRLIDAQVVAFDQPHISGDHITHAQPNDVTGHEVHRIDFGPLAIALYSRFQGELSFQCFDGIGRLMLLPETHDCIESQQD